VFESTLVVTRPLKNMIKKVLVYELPGFTKQPFKPLVYENVKKEMSLKIRAFRCYESEVEKFSHPRSIESIKNLSILRGIESGLQYAESFELIRSIE